MSTDNARSSQCKIYLHRLGCPKTDADHDLLRSRLEAEGVRFVSQASEADTVIVSTCAFISDAKIEAIDAILDAVRWKTALEGRRLLVTGCMPVRYEDELRQEIPEVDGWYGFGKWVELLNHLTSRPDDQPEIHQTGPAHPGQIPLETEGELALHRQSYSLPYAYLRVAEGCNRRCAYCAIPRMRGPYRSRTPESVLAEAERLLAGGAREIIVVAQEVNSYGKELKGTSSSIEELIVKLGECLSGQPGKRWLRVLYTHPPLFTEEFVKALADTPNLTPYLDYPVEHASDKVLRAMGRGTSWDFMRRWIDRLREAIPEIAIRTSIIVGHPGEGTGEFDELCTRLEEVRFERLGIFRYSEEEGTRAAGQDAVDETEAIRRQEIITELAEEQSAQWYQSLAGRKTEMIVENEEPGGSCYGRTVWDAPDIDGRAVTRAPVKTGDIIRGEIVKTEPYLAIIKPC